MTVVKLLTYKGFKIRFMRVFLIQNLKNENIKLEATNKFP